MGKMGPSWLVKSGKTRYQTKRLNIGKASKAKKVQGRAWKRKIFNKRKVEIQVKQVLKKKEQYLRGVLLHKQGPNWHQGNKELQKKEKLELIQLKRELKKNRLLIQEN
ncbi:unnamed protein product [Paramecium sonneborni]|uniref:Uncharacterized protein n=1 Tax=Paramecium sonneborni TaxID=65129 RepID=A0A8S1NAX6_9CILI|nr:unnamed protein product [Paramecium sonneborni]